jgi:L-ascorbate metabolism protein UlaG (beta-lactamase superfamily)
LTDITPSVTIEPTGKQDREVLLMLARTHWLGHDAFRIDGPPTLYIDPYMLGQENPSADVILVTHEHGDHCSPDDIAKIQQQETIIVTIAGAATQLSGDIRIVKPGDRLKLEGLEIEAVPAYNTSKFRQPGVPFHSKEAGHVGYVVTMDGQRIYHAGDTDAIPEMADLENIDIALLPVSGIYVMTAQEAGHAAMMIQPRVAVPMHVGRGIGAMESLQTFKDTATVPVVILEIE